MDDLMEHEYKMALQEYLPLKMVVEELRLLAASMSTHAALARKIGVSPAYLSDVLRGHRLPGPKILQFLKLEAVTVYREVK